MIRDDVIVKTQFGTMWHAIITVKPEYEGMAFVHTACNRVFLNFRTSEEGKPLNRVNCPRCRTAIASGASESEPPSSPSPTGP
jgi:hypothetical protein